MALDWFSANFLYQLGRDLQLIEIQATKEPRATLITPLARAGVYLDGLYTDKVFGRPLLPLKTSDGKGIALRETLETLLGSGTAENYGQPFKAEEITKLSEQIQEFQTVFAADLSRAPTYVVRQTGILSVDSLITDASAVFEGYLDRIPSPALWDTMQAGRCIAFDLPTAAGFHIARATEAVLVKCLGAFGKTVTKESQRNWGKYTELLDTTDANKKVLRTIDQIRIIHRNPLIHPEQTLTMPEALGLWAICCSVIQAMIADMERKEATPKIELLAMLPPDEPPETGLN